MLWGNKTETTGTIEPNLVYISEPGHPTSVDPLNAVAIMRDDGDEITAMVNLYEQIFIFKRHHIYQLIEDDDYIYRSVPLQINGPVGTVCAGTVLHIKECLYYLTDVGIVKTCGRHNETLVNLANPRGTDVDFSADVNWDLSDEFFAIDYWPNHEYWLFVASNDSDYIDTILVFNYETGTLSRHTTFASSACMSDWITLGTGTSPIGLSIARRL